MQSRYVPPVTRVGFSLIDLNSDQGYDSYQHLTHCVWTHGIRTGHVPRCIDSNLKDRRPYAKFICSQCAEAIEKSGKANAKKRHVNEALHRQTNTPRQSVDCCYHVLARMNDDGKWYIDNPSLNLNHSHQGENLGRNEAGNPLIVVPIGRLPETFGVYDLARDVRAKRDDVHLAVALASALRQLPEFSSLNDTSLFVQRKDLYNLLAKMDEHDDRAIRELGLEIGELAATLLELKAKNPGLQIEFRRDKATNAIVDLVWMFPSQLNILQEFFDVLQIDATFRISDLHMPLVAIFARTSDNIPVAVLHALISSESQASYVFVLRCLEQFGGISAPSTILSDRCGGLIKAIAEVFPVPATCNRHCLFHISRNLADAVRRSGLGFDTERARKLYYSFLEVAAFRSKEAVQHGMKLLVDKYATTSDGSTTNSLASCLRQLTGTSNCWADYSFSSRMSLGLRTTNDVEGGHCVWKLFGIALKPGKLLSISEILMRAANFIDAQDAKLNEHNFRNGNGSTQERTLSENEDAFFAPIRKELADKVSPYCRGLIRQSFLSSTTLVCKQVDAVKFFRLCRVTDGSIVDAVQLTDSNAPTNVVTNGSLLLPTTVIDFVTSVWSRSRSDLLVFRFQDRSAPNAVHFLVYDRLLHDFACTCQLLSKQGAVCGHFWKAFLENKSVVFHVKMIARRWCLQRSDSTPVRIFRNDNKDMGDLSQPQLEHHSSVRPRLQLVVPTATDRVHIEAQASDLLATLESVTADISEEGFMNDRLHSEIQEHLTALKQLIRDRKREMSGDIRISQSQDTGAETVGILTAEGARCVSDCITVKQPKYSTKAKRPTAVRQFQARAVPATVRHQQSSSATTTQPKTNKTSSNQQRSISQLARSLGMQDEESEESDDSDFVAIPPAKRPADAHERFDGRQYSTKNDDRHQRARQRMEKKN